MSKRVTKAICACFTAVLLACGAVFGAITVFSQNNAQALLPTATQDVIEEVKALNLAKGDISFDSAMKNASGETLNIWKDDKYRYYVNAETAEVVTLALREEELEKILTLPVAASSQVDYKALATSYLEALAGDMASGDMTVEAQYNKENPVEYATFEIGNKVGDREQNRATMSFAIDGTLVLFSQTRNAVSKTKDTAVLSEDAVRDIVFQDLKNDAMEAKRNTSGETGKDEVTQKTDPPLKEGEGNPDDEQIGKKHVETPEFEIYVDTPDDIKFLKVAQSVNDDVVVWSVKVQINTSWGEVDSLFNYIVSYQIDAATGEIIEKQTISGS